MIDHASHDLREYELSQRSPTAADMKEAERRVIAAKLAYRTGGNDGRDVVADALNYDTAGTPELIKYIANAMHSYKTDLVLDQMYIEREIGRRICKHVDAYVRAGVDFESRVAAEIEVINGESE